MAAGEVAARPDAGEPTAAGSSAARPDAVRGRLRRVMTDKVGVVRSGDGLAEAIAELDGLAEAIGELDGLAEGLAGRDRLAEGLAGRDRFTGPSGPGPGRFEVANLVQLGRAVAELAVRREESRGGHWRSDHPEPVEAWCIRQTLVRNGAGELEAGVLAVGGGEAVEVAEVGCP
jgi:succinate dehydrogenase/fumarate reductase flavoprotein subunit